jgi:hypothetical protein
MIYRKKTYKKNKYKEAPQNIYESRIKSKILVE